MYEVTKDIRVSRPTLRQRWEGRKWFTEVREQQNLTKTEEIVLADWITRLFVIGHSARHGFIRNMAEEIRWQWSDEIGGMICNVCRNSWACFCISKHQSKFSWFGHSILLKSSIASNSSNQLSKIAFKHELNSVTSFLWVGFHKFFTQYWRCQSSKHDLIISTYR